MFVVSGSAAVLQEVVVGTNAYSDGLVSGLATSVLPVHSFQIATELVHGSLGDGILPSSQAAYDSPRLILYFRKTPGGRVLLGGRASFPPSRNDMGQAADYRVLARVLRGLFPGLRDVPIAYRWTGLVRITPDFLPHYHMPEPNLHVALASMGEASRWQPGRGMACAKADRARGHRRDPRHKHSTYSFPHCLRTSS